jgi:tetratricopeptide (TPR) repeat protein
MKTLVKIVVAIQLLLAVPAVRAWAQSSPEAEARFNAGVLHLRKGLGQAYAAERKWDDAIEEFRKALELNPYYVDVRNDLGTALMLDGRRDEGKQEFVTAFGDPTNPSPETSAYNLGQAYLDEKNYAKAVNWFRTSMGRNAKYPQAYLGLAEALIASDRLEEAVAQLEAGVKEVPEDANLLLALGQACYKAGRFTEARSKLEAVVKKDPSGPAGRAAAEQLRALPH